MPKITERGSAIKLSRRAFLHLIAGVAALPAVSRVAWSQSYPARPVRILVGFAPGGPADTIARLVGQRLSERLGQQFFIENRTGAGTNIATEAVVNAPPDGYTLLLITAANFINATLYEKLNFNFIRDIVPVGSLSGEPAVMLVHPSVPAETVRHSSPMPRPTRARSTWRPAATAPPPTSSASCSRCRRASTWSMSLIAAPARR
jgi:tripartite-type tricarboxylate transporter receptor subunit TctC